jgi:hypothetical protein
MTFAVLEFHLGALASKWPQGSADCALRHTVVAMFGYRVGWISVAEIVWA